MKVRVRVMAMVEVLVNPDCDVCELCGSGAVCGYGLGTHVSYRHVQVRDWVVASQHRPTKPTKPNQTKPSQAKSSHVMPSQAKPSQAKPSQT